MLCLPAKTGTAQLRMFYHVSHDATNALQQDMMLWASKVAGGTQVFFFFLFLLLSLLQQDKAGVAKEIDCLASDDLGIQCH